MEVHCNQKHNWNEDRSGAKCVGQFEWGRKREEKICYSMAEIKINSLLTQRAMRVNCRVGNQVAFRYYKMCLGTLLLLVFNDCGKFLRPEHVNYTSHTHTHKLWASHSKYTAIIVAERRAKVLYNHSFFVFFFIRYFWFDSNGIWNYAQKYLYTSVMLLCVCARVYCVLRIACGSGEH